jgi:hypothetical protein
VKVLVLILLLFPAFCDATTQWDTFTKPKLTPELVDKYTKLNTRVTVSYLEDGEIKVSYLTVGCKTDTGFGKNCNFLISYSTVTELSKPQNRLKYTAKQAGKTVIGLIVLPFILVGTALGFLDWN